MSGGRSFIEISCMFNFTLNLKLLQEVKSIYKKKNQISGIGIRALQNTSVITLGKLLNVFVPELLPVKLTNGLRKVSTLSIPTFKTLKRAPGA